MGNSFALQLECDLTGSKLSKDVSDFYLVGICSGSAE